MRSTRLRLLFAIESGLHCCGEQRDRVLDLLTSRGALCRSVQELAVERLAVLEERLRELHSCRRELRSMLFAWDRLLAKTPRGKQARLLESFATHPKTQRRLLGRGIQKRGEL